jgi:hypothetical protein
LKITHQMTDGFARRAVANLSDSLIERQNDLTVLAELLPRGSDGNNAARQMLTAMAMAERAQQEFCFAASAAPAVHHNGDKS